MGAARRFPSKGELVDRFAALTAPMLSLSISDDEFGTMAASRRFLAYFCNSPRVLLEIGPESFGEKAIGHFGFFNSRYEKTLWPIAIEWLKFGRLAEGYAGMAPLRFEAS